MTTASPRTKVTIALFIPRCLAIFMAEAFSQDRLASASTRPGGFGGRSPRPHVLSSLEADCKLEGKARANLLERVDMRARLATEGPRLAVMQIQSCR